MRRISLAVLVALAITVGCYQRLPVHQVAETPSWRPDQEHATELANEENSGNGIEVGEPKVYDDYSLRLMLNAARTQLAGLGGFDQKSLTSSLGTVNGATISQTQFGLQIGGLPSPSIVTTDAGGTSSVTTNNGMSPGNASLPTSATTVGAPSQTVATTVSPVNPPPAPTVPSGLTFTPPSVSVSSIDLLNQQMQLTSEMEGLQLLLEGSLSDRFVKNQRFIKPRTTLGIPISLRTHADYKNAAAIVEVEVTASRNLTRPQAPEPPAITAILPREKTYNVAAITDHMNSVGGGAVIGAVAPSGVFTWGKKTFYLVQDQDTVAIQRPNDPAKGSASFLWEFRPVLGQQYVRGGMKQVFVQLAMPALDTLDCYGSVKIRTYWRRFDQKRGITGTVIPGSVLSSKRSFSIPRYDLSPRVDGVDYQDLGDGTISLHVRGSFLSGTYVQFGPTRFDASNGLTSDDSGVQLVVPIAAVGRWTGHILSRNGQQSDILSPIVQTTLPLLAQSSCGLPAGPERGSDPPARPCPNAFNISGAPIIKPLNETDSLLKVVVATDMSAGQNELLLQVGGKVFGLKDTTVTREAPAGGPVTITAVVPTSVVVANRKVRVFRPFWSTPEGLEHRCYEDSQDLPGFGLDSAVEKLTLVSTDADGGATYLLYGNNLESARILVPDTGHASLRAVSDVAGGRIRLLKIDKEGLKTTKKLMLQKENMERPIVLDLPDLKADAKAGPKVSVDSPVIQNTNELNVAVEKPSDVVSIKLDEKLLKWKIVDKGTIRLLNLRADGVTDEQKTRDLSIQLKGGATASLKFEVVAARISVK